MLSLESYIEQFTTSVIRTNEKKPK